MYAILRLNQVGGVTEGTCFRAWNKDITDEDKVAYIAHLKIDTAAGIIFGATRGTGRGGRKIAEYSHIFKMDFPASGALTGSNFEMTEINRGDFDNDSHVLALKPDLVNGNELHTLVHAESGGSYKLFYWVIDILNLGQNQDIPAFELYDQHTNIWGHAVFYGSAFETTGNFNYNIYEAYIGTKLYRVTGGKTFG